VPESKRRVSATPRTLSPELKIVFFDLDDTLFDHAGARRTALRTVLEGLAPKVNVSLAAFDRKYQEIIEEMHPRVLSGRLSREEARVRRFRKLTEWAGGRRSAPEARRLAEAYHQAYLVARRTNPGARELIQALRRSLAVGVITNNLVAEQEEKLRAIGLEHDIDVVVISEAVGRMKPEREIFQYALHEGDASPEEAVMVGDSWESDMEGALAAGLGAVWYRRGRADLPRPAGVPILRSFRPLNDARRAISQAHLAQVGTQGVPGRAEVPTYF